MGRYEWYNYLLISNKIQNKILKNNSWYHIKYLYNDLNVVPVKKLFYKAPLLYIIKNNLTLTTEHWHNAKQISNIKVKTMHKKWTQSTYLYIFSKIYKIFP